MEPVVYANPRIVMLLRPMLLIMNVLSLPVSAAADPTTTPSKSTMRGLMDKKGAELMLIPVRVIGC